jgi:hypothetical protein
MISDVLFEAGRDIRDYLDCGGIYGERGEPLRDWIESVAAQMEALRAHLDAGPPPVAVTVAVTEPGSVSQKVTTLGIAAGQALRARRDSNPQPSDP